MTATTERTAPPSSKPAWSAYLTTMRAQRSITATEAAHRMGVSLPTWSGLESGTRVRNGARIAVTPKDDTLHRAAKALNLTPVERRHLFALAHPAPDTTQPWQTRLKQARAAASVTQAEAARAAKVTVSTYRDWERSSGRAPRRDSLRMLLGHMGWTEEQIGQFLLDVPSDATPARAPRQRSTPMPDPPQWSRFITTKRISLGLYLSDVDERLGQQSLVRRFELGGWQRTDGRFSVPSVSSLDRVADALDMDADERAQLHLLADQKRLSNATEGPGPLICQLLHEARRATDFTPRGADAHLGLPVGTWSALERTSPLATASLPGDLLHRIVTELPVRPLLAVAMRPDADSSLVPNGPQPADISR